MGIIDKHVDSRKLVWRKIMNQQVFMTDRKDSV